MKYMFVIFLTILFVSGYTFFSETPVNKFHEYMVIRGNITSRLIERGSIVPKNKKTVFSPIDGEIIWLIDEGTEVKKDDVVVRFDDQVFKMKLCTIESETRLIRHSLEYSRSELESKKALLRYDMKLYEINLALMKNLIRIEEIPQTKRQKDITRINVSIAEKYLESAKDENETFQKLYKNKVISSKELSEKNEFLHKAETHYAQAKSLEKTLGHVRNKKRLEILKMKVKNARRTIQQAKKSYQKTIKVLEKNVAIYEEKLKHSIKKELIEKKRISDSIVKAPVSGTVIYIKTWKEKEGSSLVAVGETRWKNAKLLEIANLSELCVEIPVNEIDIKSVKNGMAVEISVLSLPKHLYLGRIDSWNTVARDKNNYFGQLSLQKYGKADISIIEVLASINKDAAFLLLKPGLTAKVSIIIEQRKNIFILPQKYIKWKNEKPYILKKKNGKYHWQLINIGISDEHIVEIKSGVCENELVSFSPDLHFTK